MRSNQRHILHGYLLGSEAFLATRQLKRKPITTYRLSCGKTSEQPQEEDAAAAVVEAGTQSVGAAEKSFDASSDDVCIIRPYEVDMESDTETATQARLHNEDDVDNAGCATFRVNHVPTVPVLYPTQSRAPYRSVPLHRNIRPQLHVFHTVPSQIQQGATGSCKQCEEDECALEREAARYGSGTRASQVTELVDEDSESFPLAFSQDGTDTVSKGSARACGETMNASDYAAALKQRRRCDPYWYERCRGVTQRGSRAGVRVCATDSGHMFSDALTQLYGAHRNVPVHGGDDGDRWSAVRGVVRCLYPAEADCLPDGHLRPYVTLLRYYAGNMRGLPSHRRRRVASRAQSGDDERTQSTQDWSATDDDGGES